LQIANIVGATVTVTAFPTADHSFSATTLFVVTAGITVSITQPPPSTMFTDSTAPLAAVATNDTTNAGIDWSVTCSQNPCGSVSPAHTNSGQTATFAAPHSPTGTVLITATSTATGPQVFATTSVTIVAPVSVQITQGVPINSMAQAASAPVVATVSNDATGAGVDWTVTCANPGACGTFSPAHTASGAASTFTAPAAVPSGNTVTIKATSTADPSKSASEIVTITLGVAPNSLLSKRFIILLTARNSMNGPFTLGGYISGDGHGNITKGSVDLTDASGNASPSVNILSPSTYSISADGRGQIHLLIDTNTLNGSFGVNGSGAITLSVVFVNPQHALLSETDSFGSATGTLDLQNANDLAAAQNGALLNGNFSMLLSGVEAASPNPAYYLAAAATIHSSASSIGISNYVLDQSDNGAVTNVPFNAGQTFALASVATTVGELSASSINVGLPTRLNLDVWLIDANHFVVTDWRDSFFGSPNIIVAGYLTAQPSSPAISGTYAFTEAGATAAAQPQATGGIFTCGSTGILDAAPLSGTIVTNQSVTAACTAPTSGRGLVTLSGGGSTGISEFSAYPTVDAGIYLLDLDGGVTGTSGPSGAGIARQQTVAAPISASVFKGAYASNFSASTTTGPENFAAQIISDGVSTITGAADVNSFNATAAPPAGAPSSGATLAGSFTAGTNGRFPLMLTATPATGQPTPPVTTFHSACYVVDSSSCLLLGLDAVSPGTGVLEIQNTGL
jgi:hypothetical protein